MKTLFLSLVTILFCSASMADSLTPVDGPLEGKSFCRTFHADGLFGQPAGDFTHCVSFKSGQMTDNANTFFGNPPETQTYMLVNNNILVTEITSDVNQAKIVYELSEDGLSIINGAGAVLELIRPLH